MACHCVTSQDNLMLLSVNFFLQAFLSEVTHLYGNSLSCCIQEQIFFLEDNPSFGIIMKLVKYKTCISAAHQQTLFSTKSLVKSTIMQ